MVLKLNYCKNNLFIHLFYILRKNKYNYNTKISKNLSIHVVCSMIEFLEVKISNKSYSINFLNHHTHDEKKKNI